MHIPPGKPPANLILAWYQDSITTSLSLDSAPTCHMSPGLFGGPQQKRGALPDGGEIARKNPVFCFCVS